MISSSSASRSIRALSGLDEAHPHRGGQAPLPSLLSQTLVPSANTCTDTPRKDLPSGRRPGEVTCKVNAAERPHGPRLSALLADLAGCVPKLTPPLRHQLPPGSNGLGFAVLRGAMVELRSGSEVKTAETEFYFLQVLFRG